MPQLGEDLLLRLIDRAYAASLDPLGWAHFLDSLAETFGGGAALFSQDSRNADASIAEFVRFDPAYIQSYVEYYGQVNVWFPIWSNWPVGKAGVTPEMLDLDFLKRSEWYGDWLQPQGLRDCIGAVLLRSGSVTTNLSLIRGEDQGIFGQSDIAFWSKLTPHMQRAVQIHRELCSARLQRDGALGALDRLAMGIVIASETGRLLFANSVADAVLKQGAGLLVSSGRLRGETADATNQLEAAIRRAALTGAGKGRHPGGVLSLPRRMAEPLSVLVGPLRGQSLAFRLPSPSAILLFSDPRQSRSVGQDDLARVFGLSRAEARLAGALLDGTRLSDYADAAGISLNTAKAQLKQVFAKTGVNRQSDLMRRVADDLVLRRARPD